MSFTSNLFLFGLLPWFILIYVISYRNTSIRLGLIAIANVIFCIWSGLKGLALLLIMSLMTYTIVKSLLAKKTKTKLITGIVVILLPLIYCKYVGVLNLKPISILGISFFTFEALSLIADTYNGKVNEIGYVDVLLYLSFFVTITSGPLVRFNDFKEGIRNGEIRFNEGVERFVLGLGKKVLIADKIAILADYYFNGVASGLNFSSMGLIIGSIAYTLQLYFDFSGYSDMAIGIGSLLGFKIPENFNHPYHARGIQDFWRRWHISLSQWFRDYIYIPLGGNRCTTLEYIRNMFVVWLLTGIWHGADITFIIWGLGYLALLLAERYLPFIKKISKTFFGYVYTLFFVNLLWIPFRAKDFATFREYLKGILSFNSGLETRALSYLPFLFFVSLLALLPFEKLKKYEDNIIFIIFKTIVYIIIFALAICAVINATYTPYIYGNF